jgi:tRNA pseudouridine38-40 synthase
MNRYFIEVAYKGNNYAGFQIQKNAITIQHEVEQALYTIFRKRFSLTGSSRTDAGVHALQNFFHFDSEDKINNSALYNLNAILPGSIVIKNLLAVHHDAHCRFDALSRQYKYFISQQKDPFLVDTAYYYPYTLDLAHLKKAANIIKGYSHFESFSKRRTQVKTYDCTIKESEWIQEKNCLIYNVTANRFLRGMVRGLVATMLQVGRGKISISELDYILSSKDSSKADFAVPAHGLFLIKVNYPDDYFKQMDQ